MGTLLQPPSNFLLLVIFTENLWILVGAIVPTIISIFYYNDHLEIVFKNYFQVAYFL